MGGSIMQEGLGGAQTALGASMLAQGNPAGASLMMGGMNSISPPQQQQQQQQAQPMPTHPAQMTANQPAPQTMGTQVPIPQGAGGGQIDPRLRSLMALMGGSQ